ncbi:MAG: hypothetical protein H0T95_03795 [Chthoniobacterales bacterium]|nr:hypothetical protein [Chthoniobacterales bacterium]
MPRLGGGERVVENEWLLIINVASGSRLRFGLKLREGITRPEVDGFYLNWRFRSRGRWINHCGYFPSSNLRLFRHQEGRYEKFGFWADDLGDNEVHEHVLLDGRSKPRGYSAKFSPLSFPYRLLIAAWPTAALPKSELLSEARFDDRVEADPNGAVWKRPVVVETETATTFSKRFRKSLAVRRF